MQALRLRSRGPPSHPRVTVPDPAIPTIRLPRLSRICQAGCGAGTRACSAEVRLGGPLRGAGDLVACRSLAASLVAAITSDEALDWGSFRPAPICFLTF